MNKLNTVRILHLAFCAGPSLFVVVALLINGGNLNFNFDSFGQEPGLIIAPVMTIALIPLSTFLYKMLLKKATENPTLTVSEKFMQYQIAFLVRCALIESAALFNGVMIILTGNAIPLIFAFIAIVALWLARPTKEKIQEDLKLKYPDTLEGY